MKKNNFLIGLWLLFIIIAIIFWQAYDNYFYLFNFSYIGTCLTCGIFLYANKVKYARRLVQFAIGLYLLVYLGILSKENMQIEGFWYYLFLGVFEAAVIHYLVAKIIGPLFFGRGWCGYACWTAIILDFLPYKVAKQPRQKIGFIRYITFLGSFFFVGVLFWLQVPHINKIMVWSFLIGNLLYYLIGIVLAYHYQDNRAFCKYICPITVFLKPASYYSLLRVQNDTQKCISCGKCKTVCPMDVDMTDNSRTRTNGTECILCLQCIDHCPPKALHL